MHSKLSMEGHGLHLTISIWTDALRIDRCSHFCYNWFQMRNDRSQFHSIGAFCLCQVVCEWHTIESWLDWPVWAGSFAPSVSMGCHPLVECGHSGSMWGRKEGRYGIALPSAIHFLFVVWRTTEVTTATLWAQFLPEVTFFLWNSLYGVGATLICHWFNYDLVDSPPSNEQWQCMSGMFVFVLGWQRLLSFLCPSNGGIMWRTAKTSVLSELGLPAQKHHLDNLQMSAIEEHFYTQQHKVGNCYSLFMLPLALWL